MEMSQCEQRSMRDETGYLPIESYGLIGNMHTSALVGIDGGIDMLCWPDFDSPSVFCRMLDKNLGGHFSISPPKNIGFTTKQYYVANTNLLNTRFLNENGVVNLVDYFPRPRHVPPRPGEFKKWLVRKLECLRGIAELDVELFPAFNYARDKFETEICTANGTTHVLFKSKTLSLRLDVVISSGEHHENRQRLLFKKTPSKNGLGDGVAAEFVLKDGDTMYFILRDAEDDYKDEITAEVVEQTYSDTNRYWSNWIGMSKYLGRYREYVSRSLLILKLLTYEPTGAIVAAPTFSLPEDFGGHRNWDYRYSWIRDSSFTVYILLRMGFKEEGKAYMKFISDRLLHSRDEKGALPIMFGIRGETDLEEIELDHLEGYRQSKPVRIGNGAAKHTQLDIYGELMDAIYLYNKYGEPISWDMWVSIREMLDYVQTIWQEKDMSIWEVRNNKQNFVYSKIFLWVAFDRGIRLADKRNLPLPQRAEWLKTRDTIYETIMEKGWNEEKQCFIQAFESKDVLDAAVLIMPLVFFIAPNDPRFLKTIDRILMPPEKGGLTSTGLVYRYNTLKSEDGVGGREGSFTMTTFWLVEALTRAGQYDPKYLDLAINMFENKMSYSNHLFMFSEEIARSGEQLGNTPQAFSHLAFVSSAFNLNRFVR